MLYKINGFNIEAVNRQDAVKFWRDNFQTEGSVKIAGGQAAKVNGDIFFSKDNWKTYTDIVYLEKEKQELIKSKIN